MPRTKEQFQAMRAATREKIHAAAVRLFTRQGFAATSVQEIADQAGISTGLMYRHYRSKEALFGALIDEAAAGLTEVALRFSVDVPPTEPIRQFTQEYLDDLAKDDGAAEFMMLMYQPLVTGDILPQFRRLLDANGALFEQTARLIERGQAEGAFRQGDPAEMTICFFALLGGLASMKVMLGKRFIVPSVESVTAALFREDSHD